MCQAATPQLKVFSSFATLSCSWQFVIVLATLEFQFIAFKQRVRPVLLVGLPHALPHMLGKRKVVIADAMPNGPAMPTLRF